MKKLVLTIGMVVGVLTQAHAGNDGPDAGFAVGGQILDLHEIEAQGLEAIPDPRQLPGFAEFVQPILDRALEVAPRFHFNLIKCLEEKTWYFVGADMPVPDNMRDTVAHIQRVGAQDDASVKLFKPWFYFAGRNPREQGALIFHEMVVAEARRVYRAVGREGDRRIYGPTDSDVRSLVAALVVGNHFNNAQLNNHLRAYNFILNSETVPISSGYGYAPPGPNISTYISEAELEGYTYQRMTVQRGLFPSYHGGNDDADRDVVVIEGIRQNGQPIYYYNGYTNIFYRLCSRYLAPELRGREGTCSGGCSSNVITWRLAPIVPPSQSNRRRREQVQSTGREILSVTCPRPFYDQLTIRTNEQGEVVR